MKAASKNWHGTSMRREPASVTSARWRLRATTCIATFSAGASELLDVCDVVPRVAVQRLLQPQLIQVVADEADGASQHEEAFKQPKAISSLHSSREKAPHDRIMSTNDTAMQPSTLRIRFARFLVVICSVSRAKSRMVVDLKCFLAYSLINTTRWSGFARDLIRWPMPISSRFSFLHLSINALG